MVYITCADKTTAQRIPARTWTALRFTDATQGITGQDRFTIPGGPAGRHTSLTCQFYMQMPSTSRPSYVKLRIHRYLPDGTADPTADDTFPVPAALGAWCAVLTTIMTAYPDTPLGVDVYHDSPAGSPDLVVSTAIFKADARDATDEEFALLQDVLNAALADNVRMTQTLTEQVAAITALTARVDALVMSSADEVATVVGNRVLGPWQR
jgi:hypothetical protein